MQAKNAGIVEMFFTALTAAALISCLDVQLLDLCYGLGLQLETLVKLGCKVEVILIILKCWVG